MKIILWIIVIAVVLAVGAFALFNHAVTTDVRIFGKTLEGASLALVGLISFGFGVFSVILFALAEELMLRGRIRKLKKEKEAMRREINALRNLPLAAEILTKDTEEGEEE